MNNTGPYYMFLSLLLTCIIILTSCIEKRDITKEFYGGWWYLGEPEVSDSFGSQGYIFNHDNTVFVVCRDIRKDCPTPKFWIKQSDEKLFLTIDSKCEFCGEYEIRLIGKANDGRVLTDSLLLIKPDKTLLIRRY